MFAGSCGPETVSENADRLALEMVRQSLLEADRAFDQATQDFGVDGWVSFFDAEGAMIQAGTGEIRGLDAIREAMEVAFSSPDVSLTWDPIRAHASDDGTLGFTVGRYESKGPGPAGEPVVAHGLYVSIWRGQADGSWKVMMDLGNPTG